MIHVLACTYLAGVGLIARVDIWPVGNLSVEGMNERTHDLAVVPVCLEASTERL